MAREFKPKAIHKIGRLMRSSSNVLRMVINEMEDGNVFLDLRQWYATKDDDKLKPTAKGVSIRLDEIESLIKMFKKARGVAEEVEAAQKKAKGKSKKSKGKKGKKSKSRDEEE